MYRTWVDRKKRHGFPCTEIPSDILKNSSTTSLVKHVWQLEADSVPFCRYLSILEKARPCKDGSYRSPLHLNEKYFTLFQDKCELNRKTELLKCCKHA